MERSPPVVVADEVGGDGRGMNYESNRNLIRSVTILRAPKLSVVSVYLFTA